jgi:nitrogen fixation/metabolism regulation signal transduction histidine kinase
MKLSVQKLQLKYGTDQFDAYFDKTTKMLIAEIDNLAHIAQSFSTFAKQPEVVTTEVDVAEKLSNVITLQRENDEQIPVRYVGPDSGVIVRADKEQISQVFVNIIRNALQASPTDIIVVLNASKETRQVSIPNGKYTVVCRNGAIDEKGMGTVNGASVQVEPQSALIIHN